MNKTLKIVLEIINRRMREYSNRQLNRRRNAFDELYDLSVELEEELSEKDK